MKIRSVVTSSSASRSTAYMTNVTGTRKLPSRRTVGTRLALPVQKVTDLAALRGEVPPMAPRHDSLYQPKGRRALLDVRTREQPMAGRGRVGTMGQAQANRPSMTGAAPAGTTADLYPSNSALYLDPNLVEGADYGRRYRRHERFDDDLANRREFARTTVIALHGGGIEAGTSELCLAIAGYHPASLAVTPAGGVTYDYWMFEGLRAASNSELHVTSTHCDDSVAVSLCAGALNAFSLHGSTTSRAGLPDGTAAVLVGGRNGTLKQLLLDEFAAAGLDAIDGIDHEAINGDEPENIANRTLLGMGGHLELTTPLRSAMFEVNTREQRKNTTTQVFWDFVAASRNALAQLEADQPIL